MSARVIFISAGPGHADYLTLKGARELASAEVVAYDALIDLPSFSEIISPNAQCIGVGKRCGAHSATQNEINQLMISSALQNKKTVRLKGGDSAIFGRLGEELSALHSAGIDWEIIPGVSSLNAAAADFSLPVTLRSVSDCVCIINGHELHKKSEQDMQRLASYPGTIVVFMGALRFNEIANAFFQAGANPDLPFVMIENAGTAKSKIYRFELSKAIHTVDPRENGGPALIMIGYSLKTDWQKEPARNSHQNSHLVEPRIVI